MLETYESIRDIYVVMELVVADALADLGLRTDQYNTLRILVADGRMRMGVLANRLLLDDSRTTRTVDSLEATGLVERASDPDDRRALLVGVTRQGRARERAAQVAAARAVDRALSGLSAREQAEASVTLALLRERIVSGQHGGTSE